MQTDNGKHILEISLPTRLKRKYKEFLISEYKRHNEEQDQEFVKLLFLGGEWNIPVDKVTKMYAEIVKAYGRVIE